MKIRGHEIDTERVGIEVTAWLNDKPGTNFIELIKQKILLNQFLLSTNYLGTSHKFHM